MADITIDRNALAVTVDELKSVISDAHVYGSSSHTSFLSCMSLDEVLEAIRNRLIALLNDERCLWRDLHDDCTAPALFAVWEVGGVRYVVPGADLCIIHAQTLTTYRYELQPHMTRKAYQRNVGVS